MFNLVIWFGFEYRYNRLCFLQLHLVKNHDIINIIYLKLFFHLNSDIKNSGLFQVSEYY